MTVIKGIFMKIFTRILIIVIVFSFFTAPFYSVRAGFLSRPPTSLGLVGYWPMDENTGTVVNDASGRGNKANVVNGATWTSGKRGKALSFTNPSGQFGQFLEIYGISQSVVDLKTQGTLSFSFWINPSSVQTAGPRIFGNGNNGTQNQYNMFLASYSGGKYAFQYVFNNGGGYLPFYTSAYFIPADVWSHLTIICTYQTSCTSYLNGRFVETTATAYTGDATLTDYFSIGGRSGGYSGYQGMIDDFRIYNRGLSASEVYKLSSSGQATQRQLSNQGLVGYWSFNEGRGSAVLDSSGNGNTGTITGATWMPGERGQALSFNGTSDKVTLGNITIANNATVSAWIKTTSVSQKPVFSNRGNSLYFGINQGKFFIYYNPATPAPAMTSNGYINDNKWHLVTWTSNGSDSNMYIDGVFDKTLPQSRTAQSGTSYIGWDSPNASEYFPGGIDDVRIYNRVLSAAEIQNLYKQNETVVNASQNNKLTNGLVSLWSFDGRDVSGTTVYDRSGNNRNGTVIGSATPDMGKIGQAFSFKNSSQYVQSGSVFSEFGTSNQPYTISGWVKVNTGVTSGNVVFMGDAWCLPPVNITGSKLRATSWNGGQVDALGTTTITPNVWYSFATTWDAANGLRIYVNGLLEKSTSMGIFSAAGSSRIMRVGYSPGGCAGDTGALNGVVDDVRVYNRSLSADEIKQLNNLGR